MVNRKPRTVRKRQEGAKYRGVYRDHDGVFIAWLATGGRKIQLGRFHEKIDAALAADFARYILWGPDPRKWYNDGRHRVSNPPNTIPRTDVPFDRQSILRKLLASRAVDAVTMANNLAAYDDVAARLAAEPSTG